jgi:hypothetical protein
MLKIVKYAIATNVFLSLLYVLSSYFIWSELDRWTVWNISSKWSPILITAYRIPNVSTVLMPVGPLLNLPFILFLVMVAANLFFIIRLQKSKETESNTRNIM